MALSVEQIQARIDALQAARDSGILSVGSGNDKITYQDPRAMDRTLARLKADLLEAQGIAPRPRVGYIEQTSKGLEDGTLSGLGYGDSDEVE